MVRTISAATVCLLLVTLAACAPANPGPGQAPGTKAVIPEPGGY